MQLRKYLVLLRKFSTPKALNLPSGYSKVVLLMAKKNTSDDRKNLKISAVVHAALAAYCEETGRVMVWAAEQAIIEFLKSKGASK
jgi:hypothetical protein